MRCFKNTDRNNFRLALLAVCPTFIKFKQKKNSMGLLSKIRSVLYGSAKALGDVNAVAKGTIGKRIKNRILGKIAGRIIRKTD